MTKPSTDVNKTYPIYIIHRKDQKMHSSNTSSDHDEHTSSPGQPSSVTNTPPDYNNTPGMLSVQLRQRKSKSRYNNYNNDKNEKKNSKDPKKSKKDNTLLNELDTNMTTGLTFETQHYIAQCNMTDEILMGFVERVVNKKMDTIKMMVESAVNRRMKDYVRKANSRGSETTIYSGSGTHRKPSANIASASRSTIKYANFTFENYNYINMVFLCDIIKNINDFHAILQKVIRELYFNPSHKENNIIYIHPSAFKTITVYADDAWRNFDLYATLEQIIRRANDVLQHYMLSSELDKQNFCEEIGKKRYESLETFTDRIDNMDDLLEFKQKLFQETEHTIVTNQMLVHPHIFEIEAPTW